LVREERIVEIAAEITTTGVTREIDATGLLLLPGVIDPQRLIAIRNQGWLER
jgi:dihydroorotase